MQRLGQLLFTNNWGYEVYALLTRERGSTKISVELYTVSPDGEMSQIFTILKKDVYNKKNAFDFILDLDGDFGRDDIDSIKLGVAKLISSHTDVVVTQTKATVSELHQAVSDFIRENAEDLQDNSDADFFIKDSFGFMLTTRLQDFLAENKELGYKKVELLDTLKVMGALQPNPSRVYDTAVRGSEKNRWFYRIELAAEKSEKPEDVEGEGQRGTEGV